MKPLSILTGVLKSFGAARALMYVIMPVNLASTSLDAVELRWE